MTDESAGTKERENTEVIVIAHGRSVITNMTMTVEGRENIGKKTRKERDTEEKIQGVDHDRHTQEIEITDIEKMIMSVVQEEGVVAGAEVGTEKNIEEIEKRMKHS